jgi:integrase/recombinase XerD
MTESNYSFQFSFQLPKTQIQPLALESHDFFGNHVSSLSCYESLTSQKPSREPEYSVQQTRQKVYKRIILKLSGENLPGHEHAINYLQHKFRRNLKVHTLLASGYNIRLFLSFLQGIRRQCIKDLTRQDIEVYVENEQDRGLKIRAVKTKLTAIYAFINYLVKADILPPEILQRKIRIKLPEALPRAIASEDVVTLLSVVSEVRDRAMIMLLIRTGMRIGELLNLHVSDINLQERKISIYIGEKNAQGRVVYFCDDAREALMEWLHIRNPEQRYLFSGRQGRPLSYAGARKVFRKYLEKSGMTAKGYTLHQLRHTFASELLNAGMRLEVLQQLLGHSTIEMTRHYARLTDRTREQEYFRAMRRIEEVGYGSY